MENFEKLINIYNRYKRWHEWEKIAAYNILSKILSKNWLTIEDFEKELDNKAKLFTCVSIRVDKKYKNIAKQVIFSFFKKSEIIDWKVKVYWYWHPKNKTHRFKIIADIFNIIDIQRAIKYYCNLFEKELKLFEEAFYHKHDLFSEKDIIEDENIWELDLNEISKLQQMINWLSDWDFQKSSNTKKIEKFNCLENKTNDKI